MPFWIICKVPKGTKVKTVKHEKPKFSFGFQWFFKVQRWLKAMKVALFCGLFAGLFLACPFEWFWPTFGCILDRFSGSKPVKNDAKNEAVFGVGFFILFVGSVWCQTYLSRDPPFAPR